MRIAAYCRVSTSKEEQLDSLAHQKEFFQSYAQLHGDELVEIYADEGTSGMRLNRRERFQALMRDAERKRFDVVVVKDISRFARNTVDFLQSVRKLKEWGVNTRFLTANMDSLGESEFVLTMFGALAQEESASLSKRVKFGKKLNAQKGRVPQRIYGYDRVDNFTLHINPSEAQVVRLIYELYLAQGLGYRCIAQQLNHRGYVSKLGGGWTPSAVYRILTNPIYCGHFLNHKYEVVNYLTGKQKKLPQQEQYHHARPMWAIVTEEQFQQAQMQRQQRQTGQGSTRYSARHLFSGLMVCQECGRRFCRKSYTYAKTRVYWKCAGNEEGICGNRTKIEERQLLEEIISHVQGCVKHPESVQQQLLQQLRSMHSETRSGEEERQRLERKVSRFAELYANDAITMEEYQKRCGPMLRQIHALREQAKQTDGARRRVTQCMAWQDWNHADMSKLVECITVSAQGTVQVIFRRAKRNMPV